MEEHAVLNEDVLKGKWKQWKGKARQQWGKLTDDDLERIAGDKDELVGRVQERYGYDREQAHREVDRWVDDQTKH